MDDSPSPLPPAIKGRGAISAAPSARFDDKGRESDGDWLDLRDGIDGEGPPPRTEVTIEHPRTIITRNQSPDISFDRSINPYRGCEHGCIYCFARPTHAYQNLSPGLDFETKLFAKPDAAALLRKELARPGYRCAPLAMGTNTDPYQPIEQRWRIMRSIVEVLAEHDHPLGITTKSARIVRDIDLLGPMAEKGLVSVMMSVTTLDPTLARIMEPRASSPRQRIAAIAALSKVGIPTSISVAPIVPAITDHEIEAIVEAGAEAGARNAFSLAVRLPHEVAPLFREWLAVHYPDRAAKVMALIQGMRGGRDNEPDFHKRFRPNGAYAAALHARFKLACRKHGLNQVRFELRTDLFRVPTDQLSLF
ncbi:PA0069 family radical SAM protein [Rhizorhabdus dicambivorans]|uniref:Radical SAM protein n=1 Tax=Rhizorhabdus dicambivorans TaxID=1850238 RepID=A0A2A4FY39_9SPHN|nr:PA0069 family radical SAM protein [Rhizorhabdus dicambivorans]ATE64105.1 radical SAM protein [Rhizorhabdus dicambivorans]PCE42622.1 radical SAM protein [Rhizorhabdus dicambivorans]